MGLTEKVHLRIQKMLLRQVDCRLVLVVGILACQKRERKRERREVNRGESRVLVLCLGD